MILITKRFLKKNVTGMALFPFILLRDKELKLNKRLINHEKIHLRQQLELLVVPFCLWYIIEYAFRYYQYKDRHKAYLNISFEREAYAHEKDLEYLRRRKCYAFFKYL
ncbi:hypothetical protein GO491_01030 [Flavobacteriaceae bacterium Ap0902]|nr:hypothetical protein [Flavobacteriaceae bacterium Ap0902]